MASMADPRAPSAPPVGTAPARRALGALRRYGPGDVVGSSEGVSVGVGVANGVGVGVGDGVGVG